MWIAQCAGITGFLALVVRFAIGGAAWQKHAIDLIEDLIDLEFIGQGWDHQGYGVGAVSQRLEIFLAHHVIWVRLNDAPIGGYCNYRFRTHMGTNPVTPVSLDAAKDTSVASRKYTIRSIIAAFSIMADSILETASRRRSTLDGVVRLAAEDT